MTLGLRKALDCFKAGANLQGGDNGVFLGLPLCTVTPQTHSSLSLQLRYQTVMNSSFLISIQKTVSSECWVQGWGMGIRERQEVSHGGRESPRGEQFALT